MIVWSVDCLITDYYYWLFDNLFYGNWLIDYWLTTDSFSTDCFTTDCLIKDTPHPYVQPREAAPECLFTVCFMTNYLINYCLQILHTHMSSLEKQPLSAGGSPLLIRCKDFRCLTFVIPRDRECQDIHASLQELSKPGQISSSSHKAQRSWSIQSNFESWTLISQIPLICKKDVLTIVLISVSWILWNLKAL